MAMKSLDHYAFFLGFALFLAVMTTAPNVANGLVSITVGGGDGVNIVGKLYCPSTFPNGTLPLVPLRGANVSVSINVGTSNVTLQTATNLKGVFFVTLNSSFNVIFNISDQNTLLQNTTITIALPVPSCTSLRTRSGNLTGSLDASLVITKTAFFIDYATNTLGIILGLINNIIANVSLEVEAVALT